MAEMIPIEPDAVSTVAGKCRFTLIFHALILS